MWGIGMGKADGFGFKEHGQGDFTMHVSPFCNISKPLSHCNRGLLMLQKGLDCTVKGAYLLRICGFARLFLLHTSAQIRVFSTLSVVYGCTPKTPEKTHFRFSGGFFASFERLKNANIVSQVGAGLKFMPPFNGRHFQRAFSGYLSTLLNVLPFCLMITVPLKLPLVLMRRPLRS